MKNDFEIRWNYWCARLRPLPPATLAARHKAKWRAVGHAYAVPCVACVQSCPCSDVPLSNNALPPPFSPSIGSLGSDSPCLHTPYCTRAEARALFREGSLCAIQLTPFFPRGEVLYPGALGGGGTAASRILADFVIQTRKARPTTSKRTPAAVIHT